MTCPATVQGGARLRETCQGVNKALPQAPLSTLATNSYTKLKSPRNELFLGAFLTRQNTLGLETRGSPCKLWVWGKKKNPKISQTSRRGSTASPCTARSSPSTAAVEGEQMGTKPSSFLAKSLLLQANQTRGPSVAALPVFLSGKSSLESYMPRTGWL